MTIGNIENYYGGLEVSEEDDKYFWSIAQRDRHCWEEIPKSLYDELVKFQTQLDNEE